ncbi:MAG: UDP-N-acetylmuramoyl-tripeptide--D-alanyl-D-alanine ligase [Patescibacteria group bacterium]|nr:UDP-N-acetylmuramoyl-tripeptide--D-alanyl-D-alanine ligase [Patescibacteria group bacterium]MDE2015445.1 UDP-N-acetylmuramoyl-tripeptide--D-alanyl-D-alanine ligase [Patescibacteria group bacterium]MDE2226940.1 UDP-N-acetylmuramoyl-tripeptide--D-alanyl-D-alanine ligase [Patescibacteria group bacterium]
MKFIKYVLRRLARLIIWRYRPGIVGITGSVGKTSTKLAIEAVLKKERKVRASSFSLNDAIGLPLTILGEWDEVKLFSREYKSGENRSKKIFFLVKVVVTSVLRLIFRSQYPEILILEYGADHPGDLKYLLDIARPNLSVITAIGDIPVHVEFFSGPEEVAREKSRLIEYLPSAGFAILNFDDESVMNLKERTRAHLMTFGFARGAEIRITAFENRKGEGKPLGISFKLEYGGGFVPVRLDGVFGKSQAYSAAAAACVGLVFGMNLVKISEALKYYVPADSRMQLMPGIKYTYVIDDSYNASPLSMHAALDTLRGLPGNRKIAVLGDMLEIGKYTIEAHERVGRLVAKIADILITVGPRAKFIAEAARDNGLRKRYIYSFDTADEAKSAVQDLIKKGDLILIKASHAMELHKVVEEIKAF